MLNQIYNSTMKNSMYHMHHNAPHAPPNITMHHIYIYLVGLPSTLYEIPCQCDRFDVKQLILRISHEIRSVSFCVLIKYRSFKKRKTNKHIENTASSNRTFRQNHKSTHSIRQSTSRRSHFSSTDQIHLQKIYHQFPPY